MRGRPVVAVTQLALLAHCVILKQPTPENGQSLILQFEGDEEQDLVRPKDLGFTISRRKAGITVDDPGDPAAGGKRNLVGDGETLFDRADDPECRRYDWDAMHTELPDKDATFDFFGRTFMEHIMVTKQMQDKFLHDGDNLSPEEMKLVRENTRRAFESALALASHEGRRKVSAAPRSSLPKVSSLGNIVGHCGRAKAMVVFPPDYNESKPLPLLFHLHGFMMNPLMYLEAFNFPIAAEIEKLRDGEDFSAIHVLPWGKAFEKHTVARFWKTSVGQCCDFPRPFQGFNETCNQDDAGYLVELLKAAVNTYNVKQDQVYVFGFSNGAFMADRLACKASAMISATAIQAGSHTGFCKPERPMPHLNFHGVNDEVVRYLGGRLAGRMGKPHVGAEATGLIWSQVNGCVKEESEQKNLFPEDVGGAAGILNETDVQRYTDCHGGVEVETWSVPGMGHTNMSAFTTFDPARSRLPLVEVMRWLWKHRRQPVVDAFRLDDARYGDGWSQEECLAKPSGPRKSRKKKHELVHNLKSVVRTAKRNVRESKKERRTAE